MPGQRRITTPSAIESRPFKPSAHLIFVSCVPAILPTRSRVDSIWVPPDWDIGRCDHRAVAARKNRRAGGFGARTPQPPLGAAFSHGVSELADAPPRTPDER